MLRKIIRIDDEKCNGCGVCVPDCAEGALQIIDGKARLISDLFCDGLGACLSSCPEGAIEVIEREAEPYDEIAVMKNMVKAGDNVIKAHLKHLRDHNEKKYFNQAIEYLKSIGHDVPALDGKKPEKHAGCPGSREIALPVLDSIDSADKRSSQLRQWPVQLHLVNPEAAYFKGAELLLTADCVPFAYADFHKDFLKDKSLAIACPKLDTNKDIYLQKLVRMINNSELKSITVMIMEVPCCGGLYHLARQAVEASGRQIQLNKSIVGIDGEILQTGER